MKNSSSRIAPIFLLLTLWLSACSGGNPDRVWLKSPGWSRGVAVGETSLAAPAPMALDDRGHLFLLLTGQDPSDASIIQVNLSDGAIHEPITVKGLTTSRLADPHLVAVGNELRLLWLEGGSLRMAAIQPQDGSVGSTQTVSGDQQAAEFSVAHSDDGDARVWFSGGVDASGIYQASLSGGAPTPVAPEGVRPSIVFDHAGNLHASWIVVPKSQGVAPIHYGFYPNATLDAGLETVLTEPSLAPSDGLEGPILGLTPRRGTVFYVITVRTGLEAGKIKPVALTFPLNDPASVPSTTDLQVPGAVEQDFDLASDNGLQVGQRASLSRAESYSQHIGQISIPDRAVPEMGAALRARVEFTMNQEQNQIGVLYFDDTGPASYQPLTFTTAGSSQPSLVVDQADYTYLSWLEPAQESGYVVYLASTRPALVKAYEGVTGQDITRMVSESLFGMMSGIVLVPLALVWMIAPLLVVAVSSFWRSSDEGLRRPSTWVPLLIAVTAYWVAKRAFLPAVFSYVPFSAWVPTIGPVAGDILRIGLPVLGTLLALWIANLYTYHRDRTSPVFFILIFSTVDGIITMALYGGLFLGF
jgi:hypothetical protein